MYLLAHNDNVIMTIRNQTLVSLDLSFQQKISRSVWDREWIVSGSIKKLFFKNQIRFRIRNFAVISSFKNLQSGAITTNGLYKMVKEFKETGSLSFHRRRESLFLQRSMQMLCSWWKKIRLHTQWVSQAFIMLHQQ